MLLAKEYLLSLLCQNLECSALLPLQQRCNRVLPGPSQAQRTQLQPSGGGGLLYRRRLQGQDLSQTPRHEPRARQGRVGGAPAPQRAPVLFTQARGRLWSPHPCPPLVPARLPQARGRAGAGAATGNLHPGRFCLPRANSRGLKVFHLERQSAFFLSIAGQTPWSLGRARSPMEELRFPSGCVLSS